MSEVCLTDCETYFTFCQGVYIKFKVYKEKVEVSHPSLWEKDTWGAMDEECERHDCMIDDECECTDKACIKEHESKCLENKHIVTINSPQRVMI
jgi:hypothetical protein